MDASTTTMSRLAGAWTDPRGVVHNRESGTGRAFCGIPIGLYTKTSPVNGCRECVRVSFGHGG